MHDSPFSSPARAPSVPALHVALLLVALLLAATACDSVPATVSGADAAGTDPGRPPNIIYILADDLGYGELGCYGQEKIKTPHIDRLAADGMRFLRHYCGAPVCAPSRCVLLTGRHLGHATIRDNKPKRPEGQWPIRADDVTIAEVLRASGYATAAIGKWGLGPVGSTGDPNAHGFDLFYGYNCQRVAHSYYPPHLWRNDQKQMLANDPPVPGRHKPKKDEEIDFDSYHSKEYAPDLMLEEARTFVRSHRDRPFFLYFAPVEPHVAIHPPQSWVDRYPVEWDEKPYRGQKGYLPHPRPRAGYAAMISDLDEHVGSIVSLIDELGLGENTLIVFSSDNGATHDVGGADTEFFASTGGLRGRKGSVYEGGIRVPMVARWTGRIAAGTTADHVSAFWDVFPTLAAVAGAEVPSRVDGISFLPTLLGVGEQRMHDHLVWEFHGYSGQQALILGAAEGASGPTEWKAVRRRLRRGNKGFELYDLARDPLESRDVASAYPDVVARATAILAAEREPSPDFPLKALDGPETSPAGAGGR